MKIRLRDLDGYPLDGEIELNRVRHVWNNDTDPAFTELLTDYSPDRSGAWFLIWISKVPESRNGVVTHPCSAVPLTPTEALLWFQEHGKTPPTDLMRDAEAFEHGKYSGSHRTWQQRPSQMTDDNGRTPLSERLQQIWDLLYKKNLSAMELAMKAYDDDPWKVDAVRKAIHRINQKPGRSIIHMPNEGYQREDAPPDRAVPAT